MGFIVSAILSSLEKFCADEFSAYLLKRKLRIQKAAFDNASVNSAQGQSETVSVLQHGKL